MTKERFIFLSGGTFTYHSFYGQLNGDEKHYLFWDFFERSLAIGRAREMKFREEMRSIYAGVTVQDLVDRDKYSIEHIVPQDIMVRALTSKGEAEQVQKGASTNPFNFMACHRYLNAKRSQRPFDFDDDEIVLTYPIHLPARYSDYGIDKDDQWVVPLMTRGDVARAILYMSLIYELKWLRERNIETLLDWARHDKPSLWEIKYNQWVWNRHKIRNPFIQYPGDNTLHYSARLLDDEELLFG